MDPALGAESNELNIEKEIEALMIDFESSGTFDPDEVVEEESVAFITDFGAVNGSEIIVINLINRFFSHRFGLHLQPKTVFFINQSETVPPIKEDINRA